MIYDLEDYQHTATLLRQHTRDDKPALFQAVCSNNRNIILDALDLVDGAPELLAALKWFVDDLTAPHSKMIDFDANLVRARAAIAKAEGNTP